MEASRDGVSDPTDEKTSVRICWMLRAQASTTIVSCRVFVGLAVPMCKESKWNDSVRGENFTL